MAKNGHWGLNLATGIDNHHQCLNLARPDSESSVSHRHHWCQWIPCIHVHVCSDMYRPLLILTADCRCKGCCQGGPWQGCDVWRGGNHTGCVKGGNCAGEWMHCDSTCQPHGESILIGASVSEPHTSLFNCDFSYIYIYNIYIYCTSFRMFLNAVI